MGWFVSGWLGSQHPHDKHPPAEVATLTEFSSEAVRALAHCSRRADLVAGTGCCCEMARDRALTQGSERCSILTLNPAGCLSMTALAIMPPGATMGGSRIFCHPDSAGGNWLW